MGLSPFGGEDLLAFNDSITRPYGAIDLTLSVREGTHQRRVTLLFHMIQCKNAFKCIIGRSLLARLDAVASTVHMKITYDGKDEISITVGADLQESRRIWRIIHKILWH